MLDLDSLAAKRARVLADGEDAWKRAVWSPEFQRISQNMSDGEVEELVSICTSGADLVSLSGYLEASSKKTGASPYTVLLAEAAKAGLSAADWAKKKAWLGR